MSKLRPLVHDAVLKAVRLNSLLIRLNMHRKTFNITAMLLHAEKSRAFTLIELSIALVIVGLIVGGVLVGRDLISAAAVRSQISQIERYNQAHNTFRVKYDFLPGDIPEPDATNFGFSARGPYTGEGDGNGIIEGVWTHAADSNKGVFQGRGETSLYWVDLSTARMIDGTFNTATATTDPGIVSGSNVGKFMPQAKIGRDNYVYAYSFSVYIDGWASFKNFFGISAVTSFAGGASPSSNVAMTVNEAYNIDKKTDDGLPQTGHVTAQYINFAIQTNIEVWAAGGGVQGANSGGLPSGPTTTATAGSSTTCYDNNNTDGSVQQYSLSQNNGTGLNCALSIRFQ